MSHTQNAEPLLLTIEQAARTLGLGRSTVYGLINDGSLSIVRVGTAVRVPLKELEDWIEGKTQRVER